MARRPTRRDLDYDTGPSQGTSHGYEPMFFGDSDLVFSQEFPELNMEPFDDDLSKQNGHR